MIFEKSYFISLTVNQMPDALLYPIWTYHVHIIMYIC